MKPCDGRSTGGKKSRTKGSTNGTGNGSKRSQQCRSIGDFALCHKAGTPGEQRHHQTANAQAAQRIQKDQDPESAVSLEKVTVCRNYVSSEFCIDFYCGSL